MTAPPLQTTTERGVHALAERHRQTVWRYLRVLGCDGATADDLTHEAFLVALRRPGFAVTDEVAALAFLRITARHLWLRSHRRRLSTVDVEAAEGVWQQHIGDGDGSPRLLALRACVEGLPERSRELLQAIYGDELSRRATAARLGIGEDGIKSALRRLRAFLHDCIAVRLRRDPP